MCDNAELRVTDYIESLERQNAELELEVNKMARQLREILEVVDNTHPSSYNPGFWGQFRCKLRSIII